MSDRSEEVIDSRERSPRSTEDLLEETEELLSGSGTETERSSLPPERASERDESPATAGTGTDSRWRSSATESTPAAEETGTDTGPSRLSRLTPSLSIGEYFSPKAFLALVLAIGAGLLAGELVVPIGGRIVGMFTVAFAIGLVASKRRYLELTAAGVSVGAVAALANRAVLALAGSGRTIIAVGATVGLLSCVIGYYFGRDLRDGLLADIE